VSHPFSPNTALKEKDAILLREKKDKQSRKHTKSRQLPSGKQLSTRTERTLKLRGFIQYPQKSSLHKLKITQLRKT